MWGFGFMESKNSCVHCSTGPKEGRLGQELVHVEVTKYRIIWHIEVGFSS